MLLVNQEYVTPNITLKEGDAVSVILRISGI
jgi:molybdopterin converting factor small subunit